MKEILQLKSNVVEEFDFNNLKKNSSILIIGTKKSGKTTLTEKILDKLKIPSYYVMTDRGCDKYKNYDSINYYNQDKVSLLLKKQRKSIEKSVLLVLDDCMDNESIKSKDIRDILIKGSRYLKTGCIIATQNFTDIPNELTYNFDYIFVLKQPSENVRKNLYNKQFGMFSSFEDFNKSMDEYTSNYGCLVLDNTSCGYEIKDTIFWYKNNISLSSIKK